jgi:hypothetical protein
VALSLVGYVTKFMGQMITGLAMKETIQREEEWQVAWAGWHVHRLLGGGSGFLRVCFRKGKA